MRSLSTEYRTHGHDGYPTTDGGYHIQARKDRRYPRRTLSLPQRVTYPSLSHPRMRYCPHVGKLPRIISHHLTLRYRRLSRVWTQYVDTCTDIICPSSIDSQKSMTHSEIFLISWLFFPLDHREYVPSGIWSLVLFQQYSHPEAFASRVQMNR
jgi:hypothetical protein